MLSVESSRLRLNKLQKILRDENLDAVIIGFAPHVYYFSTYFTNWLQYSAMVLTADGHSLLIVPNKVPDESAASEMLVYEANWNATLRSEQPSEVARLLVQWLNEHRIENVGMDTSMVGSQFAVQWGRPVVCIDPHLWQMRRSKDADELALMKKGIACTVAMYRNWKCSASCTKQR
jgi:Xaa-Pro aminopeptidase